MSYGNFCGCCGSAPDPIVGLAFASTSYSCLNFGGCAITRVTNPNDPCGFEFYNKRIRNFADGRISTTTNKKKAFSLDGCSFACESRTVWSGTKKITYRGTGTYSGEVIEVRRFSGVEGSESTEVERIDLPDETPFRDTISQCSGTMIYLPPEGDAQIRNFLIRGNDCRALIGGSVYTDPMNPFPSTQGGSVIREFEPPTAGIVPQPPPSESFQYLSDLEPNICFSCLNPSPIPSLPPFCPFNGTDPDELQAGQSRGFISGSSAEIPFWAATIAFRFDDAAGNTNYSNSIFSVYHSPTPTCYLKVWIYLETTDYEQPLTECGVPFGPPQPTSSFWSLIGEYEWDKTKEQGRNKKCYNSETNENGILYPPTYNCNNFIYDPQIYDIQASNLTSIRVLIKYSFVKDYEPADPWDSGEIRSCKPNGYPNPAC